MAENEDADDLAIIFRSAGKPVRMSSAAKWRRAITLGDLTRETPVEVEAAGRSLGVRPAGEVAALARLFDEISPVAPEPEAEPPPPDSDAGAEAVAAPVVTETPAVAPTPAPPTPPIARAPQPVSLAKPVPSKGKTGRPGGGWGVVVVLVILVIVGARGCSHRHAAAPTADAQTVYVTRHVNLRSDPSSANAPSGALERGAALTGVWNDTDRTWFKITSGDHQGSYVWGMDLADRQRPDLAVAVDAAQITLKPVTEYREPETSSAQEREVAAGESLEVAGRLPSGWWEVRNKGKTATTVAGVGYVPAEAFDSAVAAPAAPASASGALSVNGCNQSGRPISVAYAYLPPGGGALWKYKGWTRLASGECKLLFLTDNADFYLRAETDDADARLEWGGDISRCVAYPGPYEYDLELGGTCPFDSKAAGFYRRRADNPRGSFTETFR